MREAVADPVSEQLERLLCRDRRRIASIVRRASIWRSSAEIDEIDVRFDDGTALDLIAKPAEWTAMSPDARRAKPRFLWDPARERATYEHVLPGIGVERPHYYGSFVNDAGVRCILLERVSGVPLWQRGDQETWRDAAQWLARLHARVDVRTVTGGPACRHLLRYDRGFYEAWMRRAHGFHAESQSRLGHLLEPHSRVVEWLLDERPAFIHGEFYPSNVLVAPRAHGATLAIHPLDWETAAVGPPLVDLACLVAGRWSADQRADMADAYYRELAREGGDVPRREHYLRTLNACLLHVAVQNLGWSAEWIPPKDHTHDWLGDALELSEEWR